MNQRESIPNPGLLTVHLAGGCDVLNPPYSKVSYRKKEEVLEECLNYINKIDPDNTTIALENTFPTDWMDEDKGVISFYPIGKISADFGKRIRTFDIAHSGITMYTLKNLTSIDREGKTGYLKSEKFGRIPVYVSEDEMKIREIAKRSLTYAVCQEIAKADVVNIHVNTSLGLLDGFGIDEETDLDLTRILETLKGEETNLVAEVKERQREDYINAPNQKKMISYLNRLIQS